MGEPIALSRAVRAAISDADTVMLLGCGMTGLGASVGINSNSRDLHGELMKIISGEGPDVAIEAAGNPATYQTAINEMAFCGRVVCIGYAKEDVSFATKVFVQKEFDLRGSRNATPLDFQAASNYLARGDFPVSRVVTEETLLENAPESLQKWAEDPSVVTKIHVKIR